MMHALSSPIRTSLTAVCLLLIVSIAQAQWAWKEKDGRMVFSDQPPPASVSDKDITRRPAGSRSAPPIASPAADPAVASTTGSSTSTAATAPKLSGKDAELEKRKKESEAKEAANNKAEAEKIAAAKRETCERAKRAKGSFDSGSRIAVTNAKGEREIMNETQRAEETKRLQGIIASDCS
jgi:Domain of unknown function (DUF4124)